MSESDGGRAPTEVALGYGHETKKVRLRAVEGEKETITKYVNKKLAKKISLGQMIIAAFVGVSQVATISMVVGEYSFYDQAADMGAGIWTGVLVFFAALVTLSALKNAKYWKLHIAFALHIISILGMVVFLVVELGGNLRHLRYKVGRVMFAQNRNNSRHDYDYYDDPNKYSLPLLVTSLVLNSLMTVGGLMQVIGSFMMTLMTGRAMCCGFSRTSGKLFELEIAGSKSKDGGVLYIKKGGEGVDAINHGHGTESKLQRHSSSTQSEEPPSYLTSLAQIL